MVKNRKNKSKLEYKITENNCYEVINRKPYSTGYFQITVGKYYRKLAHRHIYEECFGEIPKGMLIRHKCDNRLCVNPEHLEIGTYQDNMHNKMKRKRDRYNPARGERQAFSKLTENQVKEVLKDNRQHGEIAKDFGVTRQTIQCIKSRKTWKHVEVDDE